MPGSDRPPRSLKLDLGKDDKKKMKQMKQKLSIQISTYLIIELCGADVEGYRNSTEFRRIETLREVLKKRRCLIYFKYN